MDDLVDACRLGYARAVQSAARLMAHAANLQVIGTGPEHAATLMRMSSDCSQVAALLSSVLADVGRPTPVSFTEIELISDIPDVMCPVDVDAIAEDAFGCYAVVEDGLQQAMAGIDDAGIEWALVAGAQLVDLLAAREASWAD